MQTETFELIDKAVAGNKKALEGLILGVEDMIYNLSLRMLGSVYDAQDATQEIIIKIITQLSAFRKECAFSTWVYRVAANYLINYKKSMFAQRPLSFEFYGQDIDAGFLPNSDDLLQGVEAVSYTHLFWPEGRGQIRDGGGRAFEEGRICTLTGENERVMMKKVKFDKERIADGFGKNEIV